MVNSAQFDELTVRDLVRQVAAVARRQPYLLAPADHQRLRADLTEHGADVVGGQRPGNPELRSPSPASLADSRQAKPDMRPIRGMSGRGPRKRCLCSSDRLYLNVCTGLCIAGGENRSLATSGSWGASWHVAGFRWLMRNGPRQGRRDVEATSIQSARP